MDWKRIFLRCAGFGAGFAVALTIIAGIFIWYSSRPTPPKPWDNKKIEAIYGKIIAEHEVGKIGLRYALKNNEAEDYRIDRKDSVQVSIRVGDEGELAPFNHVVSLETPIFVPAGHRTMVFLDLNTGQISNSFKRPLPAQATETEEKDYLEAAGDYLSQTRITGFAVFDEGHRLEIDFPAGWKKPSTKK